MSSLSWAIPPLLPMNPIFSAPQTRPGDVHYVIHLRMIEHGISVDPDTLTRELLTTERTFSQCEGVDLQIEIDSTLTAPQTTLQDNLVSFPNNRMTLTSDFFKLYLPFFETRKARVFDVHWFDALNSSARQDALAHNEISIMDLGWSLKALNMENVYADSREPRDRTPSLKQLAGDSVQLAAGTLQAVESEFNSHPVDANHAYREYHSSLLAHELGHILLDESDGTHSGGDHDCPSNHQTCPSLNLMTAGGFSDLIWYDRFQKVLGYSPLPALEKEQCEILKRRLILFK